MPNFSLRTTDRQLHWPVKNGFPVQGIPDSFQEIDISAYEDRFAEGTQDEARDGKSDTEKTVASVDA